MNVPKIYDESIIGFSLGHCPRCYPNGATAADYPRAASAHLRVSAIDGTKAVCALCGTRYEVSQIDDRTLSVV